MNKKQQKILIIDDDPDIVTMVKSRLEANGYDVVSANSGEMGLEKIKNEDPELIILDVILPGMSGYEVCTMIKNDEKLNRPVVMLTSRNKDVDRKIGFICKADGYVVKPQSYEMLLPEIERVLAKSYVKKGELL